MVCVTPGSFLMVTLNKELVIKINKYFLLTVFTTVLGTSAAQAADGTITINGSVTNSACTAIASVTADTVMSGPSPINSTLTLPPVTADTLNMAPGTYVGQTPFSIQLTGCSAAMELNNIRAVFTSVSSPKNDPYVMANRAVDGAANVAIAIMQPNGVTQIDLNGGPASDPGHSLPVTAGPLTLNYMAAYKSLSSGVTAGSVTGVADFIIHYF